MQNIEKRTEKFLNIFYNHFNGEKEQPFHKIRTEAANSLAQIGFPDTKQEEWRFTNISPLLKSDFIAAKRSTKVDVTAADIAPFILPDWQGSLIVLVDGFLSSELSKLQKVDRQISVKSIYEELSSRDNRINGKINSLTRFEKEAFTALNTAFLTDGLILDVPANTVVEKNIHILHVSVSNNTMSSPRSLITIGDNSRVTIVESFHTLAEEAVFVNRVSEIFIGENSHVNHYKLQNESELSYHIGQTAIEQAAHSVYTSGGFDFGGKLVRNNISTLLNGEGITTTLNGLYIAKNTQHIDNHTFIDHAKPHCDSHEVYRGILKDKAKGVFSGKILVRQDAQKTDAKQSNNCLLLSENAQIDAKPQLEIYADDVKCTHGATVGQLDEQALFYLRARGIPYKKAMSMLTYAFAEEIIENVKDSSLQKCIEDLLLDNLDR